MFSGMVVGMQKRSSPLGLAGHLARKAPLVQGYVSFKFLDLSYW